MKKIILPFLVLLSAVFFRSAAWGGETFSLSLDVTGSSGFTQDRSSLSPGAGGEVFAAWRIVPALALGTDFGFQSYFNPGDWQENFWDVGGYLFPFGTGKEGEWYLQGTAGLNLAGLKLANQWTGNYHGEAGVGYRAFAGGAGALDLGVMYDFFSPANRPLQAVGLKAGWIFLFGK